MKTVLIIDDDPGFRVLLREWLGGKGWEVLEAQDGEEGIRVAQDRRPGVVLCDLLMAPTNGFQVCRALRGIESTRLTRIIVTTGRDFESDRRAALEAGADEYLTKPLEPSRLLDLMSRGVCESLAPELSRANPLAPDPGVRLKFWGVRGSVPTPGPTTLQYGGNTSCVEVRAAGRIIILDAGTGLRLLGRELLAEFGEQPLDLVLLLTHTHWDHIQGLPFFMPVYQPQNRLRILGFEGARHGLDGVLSNQMATPFFPVGLREVPANITIEELNNLEFNIGPIRVQARFANHPGICVGYRLSVEGRSIAFFPDNELRHEGPPLSKAGDSSSLSADFARQENEKLAEFLRGTDVLIMDTQYDSQEYRDHMGWGHGCVDEVVCLAMQAEVKQLYLFHHDPDHDDSKIAKMAAQARRLVADRKGSLEVEAAREGATVELSAVPRSDSERTCIPR